MDRLIVAFETELGKLTFAYIVWAGGYGYYAILVLVIINFFKLSRTYVGRH